MPLARYGQFNQAGDLAPHDGPQAVALRGWHGPIIRPLPYLHKYGGNLGAIAMRPAIDIPYFAATQYGGDLPGMQQPGVYVPDPYNDPDAGAP